MSKILQLLNPGSTSPDHVGLSKVSISGTSADNGTTNQPSAVNRSADRRRPMPTENNQTVSMSTQQEGYKIESSSPRQGQEAGGDGDTRRRRNSRDRQSSSRSRVRAMGGTGGGFGGDVTTHILVPSARVGAVIGKGGDVIRGIREMTATRVIISSAEEEDRDPNWRLVSITGAITAACWAVEMIAHQAGIYEQGPYRGRRREQEEEDEGDQPEGFRIVIDKSNAGQLIGKKGAIINEIRQQSGARIQVVNEEESTEEGGAVDERIVLIHGDARQCRRAHQLIIAALSSDPNHQLQSMHQPSQTGGFPQPGNSSSLFTYQPGANPNKVEESQDFCEVTMRIPNDKIGRVIGKGGASINEIRTEAGCRIEIENARTGEAAIRRVILRGSMEQTQAAQKLITAKMQEQA